MYSFKDLADVLHCLVDDYKFNDVVIPLDKHLSEEYGYHTAKIEVLDENWQYRGDSVEDWVIKTISDAFPIADLDIEAKVVSECSVDDIDDEDPDFADYEPEMAYTIAIIDKAHPYN